MACITAYTDAIRVECLGHGNRRDDQMQDELESKQRAQSSLLLRWLGCILLPMSFRPVRKIAGIGNVFLGAELVDIAEYDLEIYEENPEDHEHHGANWTPGSKKIEGTVVGELPIRKDLRLVTEEGYAVNFYLRDSFGSVMILDPLLDSSGNPVR
jgi:hypothetical protein